MAPDEGGRAIRDEDADDGPRRNSQREEHLRANAGGGKESEGDDRRSRLLHNRFFQIGAGLVVLALIAGSILYWLNARHYENTDDAFIDAHIVHLSPQVAGRVSQVVVNDNQLVHKGDPLVEIDPVDMQAKLAQVEAQAAQAEKQYQQALAVEKGAEAQAENAARDVERYQTLVRTAPQAVAQQQLDQAIATQRNTAAQLESARAQIASAQAQIDVYKAQIDAARLNLGYTHIVAPVDGHIAQRTVAVGNYVSPGQQLMAIVPLDVWVTA
ncbi:MAG: HlyD family secretion protein, partial [Alphaproteobacteria bacterium]|nr:HlyD family secretion protein [Alphaproteobacteria bacterium]